MKLGITDSPFWSYGDVMNNNLQEIVPELDESEYELDTPEFDIHEAETLPEILLANSMLLFFDDEIVSEDECA